MTIEPTARWRCETARRVVVFLGDDGAVMDGSYRFVREEGAQIDWAWRRSELDKAAYPSVVEMYDYGLSRLPLLVGGIMFVGEIEGDAGDGMKAFSELAAHKSSVVYGKGDEAGLFDKFTTDMVSLEATKITVTDTLSDNVELASKDIVLTVKDASGKVVASGTNKVTLPATALNAKATLTASVAGKEVTVAFPAGYKSEDGWSYEFAEQLTLANSAPKGEVALADTSDTDTGTWAGQRGLFTSVREASKVTYTTGSGMERADVFPMPVVLASVAKPAEKPSPTPTPTPKATPSPKPTTQAPSLEPAAAAPSPEPTPEPATPTPQPTPTSKPTTAPLSPAPATPEPVKKAKELAATGAPILGAGLGALLAGAGASLLGLRRRASR